MTNAVKSYLKALETRPKYPKFESFHWADYVELLCLANVDGEVSMDDVIDRLTNRERDLYESDPDDLAHIEELSKDEGIATGRARINDEWQSDLENYFRVLQFRQSLYGDDYPFHVSDKEITQKNRFSDGHVMYVYLVLCSNLYLLDDKTRLSFASFFELLCFDVLKNMLPKSASLILFGTNPFNKGKYSGKSSFVKKVKDLAEELNEKVSSHFNEEGYSERNRGEDGLDIVARIPTGDTLPSSLVFLGQCACTTDWVNKQSDSSHEAWANKINFANRTSNVVMIPFCFRAANGGWVRTGSIRSSFLLDRKRLLHQLKPYKLPSDNECFNVVKEILKTSETVV